MMPLRALLLLALLVTPLIHGQGRYEQVEDAIKRKGLPEWYEIAAAPGGELTKASARPEAPSARNWNVSHGDAASRRYSALTQINRGNVHELQAAWTYHSNDGTGTIQCNPIVVDGVMYAPTVGRAVVAVNATNGKEIWRYQLETPRQMSLDEAPARRGLVYWPGVGGHGQRVVFACGKWLYALDPKTGKPVSGFGENGRVPLPTGGTAVGVIWQGTYIVPGFSGDVFSYDLVNGKQLWRFHTVPRDGDMGAESWSGTGRVGANCWGGLALDVDRGLVFAAIGAARPDFIGVERHGDNLFANCVVALDAKTGARRWHFQNIRHDLWDLDNPAPPNLVTLTREGRRVDAVACVTKTGHTLLLDRESGNPVFPFRMRRAPVSTLPGEVAATYQPDPQWPEPFGSPEFKLADVTSRTPEARAAVLKQVQRASFGWFEPPSEARPMLYRSSRGGAEWTGAAIDVPTGRLYVSSNHLLSMATVFRADERERDPATPPSTGEMVYLQLCVGCHGPNRQGVGTVPTLVGLRHRMSDEDVVALFHQGRPPMPPFPTLVTDATQRRTLLDFLMRRQQPEAPTSGAETPGRYFAVGYKFINDHEGYPGSNPPWGQLNCIDLNTGKIIWRVPLGEYEDLAKQGVPKTGTENFGGPTVTAGGLVFCAGTRDEKIRAFDQDTGEELWSAKLPFGGYAPPSVFEVNGRQFIVVAASGGGRWGRKWAMPTSRLRCRPAEPIPIMAERQGTFLSFGKCSLTHAGAAEVNSRLPRVVSPPWARTFPHCLCLSP